MGTIDPAHVAEQIDGFLQHERAADALRRLGGLPPDPPLPEPTGDERPDFDSAFENARARVILLDPLPAETCTALLEREIDLGDFGVILWRGDLPSPTELPQAMEQTATPAVQIDPRNMTSPYALTDADHAEWLRQLARLNADDE